MLDAITVWPVDVSSPEAAFASLTQRSDLWAGADVVGVGSTARTVRDLHVVAHGLVRVLVGELGFSAVLLEGDRDASEKLDAFVSEGVGDPRAVLTAARPFLATEESLELVRWLRHHNETDLSHKVRIVHGGNDDLSTPATIEASLADEVISWRERFGHRVVYLGGAAHTAVIASRVVASTKPAEQVASAGALLRRRLGARYCSVGLTFGSGAIPHPVPPPAPGSLEARLGVLPHETALSVPVDPQRWSQWMAGVDRVRLVGPGYDPHEDPDHAITGDPTNWFDHIIHQKVAAGVHFLS